MCSFVGERASISLRAAALNLLVAAAAEVPG